MGESYETVLAFLLADGTTPADCFRLPRNYNRVLHSLRSDRGRKELSLAIGRPVGQVPWDRFEAQRASMKRHAVCAVTFLDSHYPLYLRDIPRVPPIIFYRGDLTVLHRRGVAIVGTRHPSARGCDFACELAGDLAALGITIISGAARGIDTAAHRGALARSGATVAVVATGLDIAYPQDNAELLLSMARQGCVLGEQIMGTPPLRYTFPQRNRLISALSQAVVVVEAGRRSGALVTARWALEQGREVGAVPGFPGDPRSHGVIALLKSGAFPVESADDILAAVPRLGVSVPTRRPPDGAPVPVAGLSMDAVSLLDVLGRNPTDPDTVARRLKADVARVQAILLELEVCGVVACDAMGMYYRV